MVTKRVLDVGQCGLDHGTLKTLIERNFDARVEQADDADATLAAMRGVAFDLVLVNRQLDGDGSEGVALIQRIKAEPALAATPIMLVTNFPQHQQIAIAAGAEPGFGKGACHTPETRALLARYLKS